MWIWDSRRTGFLISFLNSGLRSLLIPLACVEMNTVAEALDHFYIHFIYMHRVEVVPFEIFRLQP